MTEACSRAGVTHLEADGPVVCHGLVYYTVGVLLQKSLLQACASTGEEDQHQVWGDVGRLTLPVRYMTMTSASSCRLKQHKSAL